MFVTVALILCIAALIFCCVVILMLSKALGRQQAQHVDNIETILGGVTTMTMRREEQTAQIVRDLEMAVELLHEELEKTRKND